MRMSKFAKLIMASGLIVLLSACGSDSNQSAFEDRDNEQIIEESVFVSEEPVLEITANNAENEGSEALSTNDAEETVFEEDNQASSLKTFEGDYTTILDEMCNLIRDENALENGFSNPYFSWGIEEFILYEDCSVEEKLSLIGYTFIDVNNDGCDDLLIGPVDNEDLCYSDIFYIYTLQDGKVVLTMQGWYRNLLYLYKDNVVFNYFDDGGTTCRGFRTGTIGFESWKLEYTETYFWGYIDEENAGAWFYNDIGSIDYHECTRLDWSYDQGWELYDERLAERVKIDYTSLADFELVKTK